jgi:hypothetical protein
MRTLWRPAPADNVHRFIGVACKGALPGDRLGRLADRLRVAELAAVGGRVQVLAQVVTHGTRLDVEPRNIGVGDPLQVLHERTQAVAVRGDQHHGLQGGGLPACEVDLDVISTT